ncbi:MAG: Holliday junction resolvase RuvX [Bacillota bacterium]
MRIMGLDIGSKTIGVALSDPLGWTAQGLEVVRRKKPETDLERLVQIITEYGVEKVVAGLPKNMDGTMGPAATQVLEFVERLQSVISIPVVTRDERLSTVAAERALLEADVSRAKRKKVIDKMAAVFILQGYLDSIENKQ